MENSELNDIIKELREKAISYFEDAYQNAPDKTEPSIIFQMHLDIHKLETEWHRIIQSKFPTKKLQIIPIFIHKHPTVDFVYPKDPSNKEGKEIGDLLYIHTDLKKNLIKGGYDKVKQTALLLQAKVNSNKTLDKKQVHLYAKWPNFSFKNKEFKNKKNLAKNTFNVVTPPNYHIGARYLFIENRKGMEPVPKYIEERFYTIDVTEPIDNNKKTNPYYLFVDNLIKLLDFSEGKEVDIKEPPSDDWSKAINAISDWAIGKWNKNRLKKSKGEPRFKLLSLFRSTQNEFINNNRFDFQAGPKRYPSDFKYDSKSRPFIIIHIITFDDQINRD